MRKRREPDFTTYILGEPNMNPLDLFNQVKEMIEKKDFDAAKKFVDDNKDNLGGLCCHQQISLQRRNLSFRSFLSLG